MKIGYAFCVCRKSPLDFSVLGLFLSKLFNGHNYDVYQISDENNRSREYYCSNNTINWQGQIRFLGVEAVSGFVFLMAGRQPDCFVSLAMPPFPLPKNSKGLSGEKKWTLARKRTKACWRKPRTMTMPAGIFAAGKRVCLYQLMVPSIDRKESP